MSGYDKCENGRWSDGNADISISIYSDSSFYQAYDEIGSIHMADTEISGTVWLIGTYDDGLFVICGMNDGTEIELHYKSDGTVEVTSVSAGSGIEEGTQLECIERFRS